jgi:adenylate kinase
MRNTRKFTRSAAMRLYTGGALGVLASLLLVTAALMPTAVSAEEGDGPYVIMIGAPGSGKSTASAYISDSTGVPIIEVGEMLRDELANAAKATRSGRPGSMRSTARAQRKKAIEEAKGKLEAGVLVDDRAIDGAVAVGVLAAESAGGFILDGYPASLEQAQFLDSLLAVSGAQPIVIFLEVPDDVALERMQNRGRIDDKYGIAKQRLEMFHKNIQPVLEYYEDAGLYRVDATKSIPDVLKQVEKIIEGQ